MTTTCRCNEIEARIRHARHLVGQLDDRVQAVHEGKARLAEAITEAEFALRGVREHCRCGGQAVKETPEGDWDPS